MSDISENSLIQCLNCGTEFSGSFCPHCGQKSRTKRLTLFSVIKDFLDAISDSDRGFLRTVLDLSQNPGEMLHDYMAGKRQRYLSAGKYTFFIVVIFTLQISMVEQKFGFFKEILESIDKISISDDGKKGVHLYAEDSDATDSENKKQKIESDTATQDGIDVDFDFSFFGKKYEIKASKEQAIAFTRELIPRYHRTLFDVLKFLIVLWVPIFSFFSYLIFFRHPYNFAEHITMN
ncbi:MAG: DUF3667 domain-containing protein, partial [Pseudomonadota bacterium]